MFGNDNAYVAGDVMHGLASRRKTGFTFFPLVVAAL